MFNWLLNNIFNCLVAWTTWFIQQCGQNSRFHKTISSIAFRIWDVISQPATSVIDEHVILASSKLLKHVIFLRSLIYRKINALIQKILQRLGMPLLGVDTIEAQIMIAMTSELLSKSFQMGSLFDTVGSTCLQKSDHSHVTTLLVKFGDTLERGHLATNMFRRH